MDHTLNHEIRKIKKQKGNYKSKITVMKNALIVKYNLDKITDNPERINNLKDIINPLQLFVEKRKFFNQNNQSLNNIIYH